MPILPVMKVTRKSDSKRIIVNKSDYNKDLHILQDAPKAEEKQDAPKADEKQDAPKADENNPISLRQAVLKLDIKNESHWTDAGLPMMKIVEGFLGYNVTRKELEDVASDITRETIEDILDGKSNS